MITYICIDDEPFGREGIDLNAKDIPFLEKKAEFQNAILASDWLSSNEVDLIFLDIEMPGLNGIDFIKTLKSRQQIVLTTAYPQFALEAFELDVIDYLVKPIKFDRFLKAVNKVREILEAKQAPESIIEAYEDTFMYIKSERKYVKIYYKDVLYIKGLKDYVMIFTNTAKIMTALNIKTIHKQLPSKLFARVSKSYIVQVRQIETIDVDEMLVGKTEIPLGPSYKEEFIKKYVLTNLVSRK